MIAEKEEKDEARGYTHGPVGFCSKDSSCYYSKGPLNILEPMFQFCTCLLNSTSIFITNPRGVIVSGWGLGVEWN